MEKIVAIVKEDIVQAVFYMSIPNDIEESEQKEYLSERIKTACKNSNVSGNPFYIKDGEAKEGYMMKNGKFYERERIGFFFAFNTEIGPVVKKINYYIDKIGIEKKLSEYFPGIKEFFIVPDDQVEYIKSLPIEALDLSEPDIIIKGAKQ